MDRGKIKTQTFNRKGFFFYTDSRPARRAPPLPVDAQASVFSFFLFFFRKDGVRNFFFFLVLGDLEGELSGDSASSIFSPERTVFSMLSTLVVNWLTRLESSSSTSPWLSLPFIRPAWFSVGGTNKGRRSDTSNSYNVDLNCN